MKHPQRIALLLALACALLGPGCAPEPAPLAEPEAQSRPSAEAVRLWRDRKVGMFIHWGLYSIPGGVWSGERITKGYSEQIQSHGEIPTAEYETLAARFEAPNWDPDAIAELARSAGMKFIVLTTKHHDGFNLFHTAETEYNAVDATPYGRDVVKGLAEACARAGLSFGVYYSTIDWHHPDATPPNPRNDNAIPPAHEELNVRQLKELMTGYGPLSEIWFDMGEPTPEQSKRFADTVHRLQPDCMVSGRVFNHQGDFTVMGDNQIPEIIIEEPWQTPASIYGETWGYRSWQEKTDLAQKIDEHILKLVQVVSRGGNYLLNIGPRGDGSVVGFEEDVLRGVGRWLEANGEAIYASEPQPFRELDFGYATVREGRLYLMVSQWPADGRLRLPGLRSAIRRGYLLADGAEYAPGIDGDVPTIEVSGPRPPGPVAVVVAEFDGELRVVQPAVGTAADGSYHLSANDASKMYNYNGRGYYERPTVYHMQWHVAVAEPGRYELRATLGGEGLPGRLTFTVGDQSQTRELSAEDSAVGVFELQPGEDVVVTLTPPEPFEKGDAIGVEIEALLLKPVAD